MPFALQYKPLIESESSTSKTLIRPRNIYKINNYKYKDGITKSLAGFETSLVFIIGISPEKVVSCLKITLIKPDLFFKWLKKLVRAGLSEEEMKNTESLEDLIIVDNKDGKKIFNQFVKPSRLYIQNPPAYRTYLLKNIKNIEEVKIKKEILLNYLK
jgi:hypothetical protein